MGTSSPNLNGDAEAVIKRAVGLLGIDARQPPYNSRGERNFTFLRNRAMKPWQVTLSGYLLILIISSAFVLAVAYTRA